MISFRNVTENDFSLLYKWCSQEFVYEWFEQRKLSKKEIIDKYQRKLDEKKQELYIIQYNNKDIGYTQLYPYEEDNNKYEYDLFIGEEDYLNKGIGTTILKEINKKIEKDHNITSFILRPFKRNKRSIRCYEKAGFKIISEYKGKNTIGEDEIIVVMEL